MFRKKHFHEAAKLRPGNIVTNAIADCQKAKALASAMQQIDEKASLDAEKSQQETEKAMQAEMASTLTNANVIELCQKKLPNALIIQKIKTSKCKFDTSPDALVALTSAGVTEEVMMIMLEKGN